MKTVLQKQTLPANQPVSVMAAQGHWCKMGYIEWREKAKLGSKLYAAQAKVRKCGEKGTELHEGKE